MKTLLTFIFLTLTLVSQGQEVLWDTSFVVDQVNFKVIAGRTESGGYAQLIRNNNDTTTLDGVAGNIEILNYNDDKYPDITFSYLGNNYVADLFLYNQKSKSYNQVQGFNQVSDSRRLKKETDYYFSYRSSGCADMNWTSYLFEIVDDSVNIIGTINGIGCERETRKKISVFKNESSERNYEIETFPIDKITEYENYKWGFIEEYWNKNLNKFKK